MYEGCTSDGYFAVSPADTFFHLSIPHHGWHVQGICVLNRAQLCRPSRFLKDGYGLVRIVPTTSPCALLYLCHGL
jgi:hypothetical protein